MSLHPGKHIAENLRLVRLIGRGAMGSVWLADHLGLQSQVAVKFMSQAQLEDPVSVQRFRQEARAAAEIRSPHVVQVFDHGITEEHEPYIVMELLDGESLDKRIKRLGPLSPQEAASVVAQAAKALAKAHERGIIHRDVKPQNIFVLDGGGEPFVKVLDFGVAKFSGAEAIQMTAAGNMVGTPAFMGPEQLFHGQSVDHRGDLWSLAVCAYYALTGMRPFEGATLGELCVAIKRGGYVRPTTLRNDLPPDVDAWFARAFHTDLAGRFATAKEMAQELERAVGLSSVMHSTPSGVAAGPVLQTYGGTALSSHPRAALPAPARRWPLWLAVACVVGLALGGAALFVGKGRDPSPQGAASPGTEQPAAQPAAGETRPPDTVEHVASATANPTIDLEVELKEERRSAPPRPAGSAPTSTPLDGSGPKGPKPRATEPPPAGGDERQKKAAETLGI